MADTLFDIGSVIPSPVSDDIGCKLAAIISSAKTMAKAPVDVEDSLPSSNCNMCSQATSKSIFLTSPSGEPTNFKVKRQLGCFDIFKIGVGPSSSHTNGPMLAGYRFSKRLRAKGILSSVTRIQVDLFGSLALTGLGHGTDKAACVGLAGGHPSTADPDICEAVFHKVQSSSSLAVDKDHDIVFVYKTDMLFHMDKELHQHPNALHISAYNSHGSIIHFNEYFSIGGGTVQSIWEYGLSHGCHCDLRVPMSPVSTTGVCTTGHFKKDRYLEAPCNTDVSNTNTSTYQLPFPFSSAAELVDICKTTNMTIAEVMMENEIVLSACDRDAVNSKLDEIWKAMYDCIERGIHKEGTLPVSGIRRNSALMYKKLMAGWQRSLVDHFAIMDWICLYARAVNEENACGGRIVTAPTNGASGTLPAVLTYFDKFSYKSSREGVRTFLLTAAAFGALIKTNASVSGAECGCQAEVGSACAMAAAGLTAALGGTIEQIENAAEIGLEHNLGMTCDPINGLVQVPCIERNCLAAVKAVTAQRLSFQSDGAHEVSFDSCVETMYRTGLDMQAKYRETSTGGLALYARKPHLFRKGAAFREIAIEALDFAE